MLGDLHGPFFDEQFSERIKMGYRLVSLVRYSSGDGPWALGGKSSLGTTSGWTIPVLLAAWCSRESREHTVGGILFEMFPYRGVPDWESHFRLGGHHQHGNVLQDNDPHHGHLLRRLLAFETFIHPRSRGSTRGGERAKPLFQRPRTSATSEATGLFQKEGPSYYPEMA